MAPTGCAGSVPRSIRSAILRLHRVSRWERSPRLVVPFAVAVELTGSLMRCGSLKLTEQPCGTSGERDARTTLRPSNPIRPCELLPLFDDGGLDRSGDRRNQGQFRSRAQVQGGTHFVSKYFFCFYSFGDTVGSGLHGVAGDHRPGFAQASLWITPSAGRGSPIGVGMFEPCAPMSMPIRNAMPVPMPPVVLPADGMPAPLAGVVNQFDRPGPKLVRGALGCERGRQRRCRQSQAADNREDQRTHLRLPERTCAALLADGG